MNDSTERTHIIQTVPCPVCRALTRFDLNNPYRPFCSERCRLIDLGQWLQEDYRFAGESVSTEPNTEE
jgi:uncharacterized protein